MRYGQCSEIKRFQIGLVLAVTALLTTTILTGASCGAKLPPNTTPEARVAIYTHQALTIADRVLTEVDGLTERRLALATTDQQREDIKSQARAVAVVVLQIGRAGNDLADALRTWAAVKQAAMPDKPAAERVRIILQTIQNLIPQIGGAIKDPTLRANVSTTLDIITTLVLNVTNLVPAPSS